MRILSIDPGMESGIVALSAADDARPTSLFATQRTGGLEGLKSGWWLLNQLEEAEVVVCEKFSPRPGARSFRLNELEPLRIEGYIEAFRDDVTWRKPEQRKLVRSLHDTADFLRWAGLWTLPGDLGRRDANDANAAMMHALGYLRDAGHVPTIEMLIEYGTLGTEEES